MSIPGRADSFARFSMDKWQAECRLCSRYETIDWQYIAFVKENPGYDAAFMIVEKIRACAAHIQSPHGRN